MRTTVVLLCCVCSVLLVAMSSQPVAPASQRATLEITLHLSQVVTPNASAPSIAVEITQMGPLPLELQVVPARFVDSLDPLQFSDTTTAEPFPRVANVPGTTTALRPGPQPPTPQLVLQLVAVRSPSSPQHQQHQRLISPSTPTIITIPANIRSSRTVSLNLREAVPPQLVTGVDTVVLQYLVMQGSSVVARSNTLAVTPHSSDRASQDDTTEPSTRPTIP